MTAASTRLSAAQRAEYDRAGYLAPLDAFEPGEAADCSRRLEALLAPRGGRPDVWLRNSPHLLLRWMADLVRDARLLDPVEDLLGPDLLVLRATLFVKPPRDPGHIAWHQDIAFWDLDDGDHVVTAWIALTDSSAANGCVRVVPGSHRAPLRSHRLSLDPHNRLLRSQACDGPDAVDRSVCIELRAGQISLHHPALVHGSPGNPSDRLRAGLAVRCMTPAVRHYGPRQAAMLVRGHDPVGLYEHQPAPRFDGDPQARVWHRRALRRYAAQVAWQSLRCPSPRQLALLARLAVRPGALRALLQGARGISRPPR